MVGCHEGTGSAGGGFGAGPEERVKTPWGSSRSTGPLGVRSHYDPEYWGRSDFILFEDGTESDREPESEGPLPLSLGVNVPPLRLGVL